MNDDTVMVGQIHIVKQGDEWIATATNCPGVEIRRPSKNEAYAAIRRETLSSFKKRMFGNLKGFK